jgi:hypothetical protein
VNPRAPVTLPSAISTLTRLGYVVTLDDTFMMRGVEYRLSVIDDVVWIKGDKGRQSWGDFSKSLRPQ